VQAFLNEVIDELAKGNRLEFRDFGVFEVRERAARMAQNPRTLERVPVPPKRSVKFKVGRLMRDKVESPSVSGVAADSKSKAPGTGAKSSDAEPLEVKVTPAATKGQPAHNGLATADR